jgi:hypothetical protein
MIPGYYTGPSGSFDFDGDTIGFIGQGTIWVKRHAEFELLAASGQPAPGGGTFDILPTFDFNKISIDGRNVAFSAYTYATGRGLYTDIGGALWRVVGRGDVIFGETVSLLQFGADGMSGDQIVFWASFTSGNSGIFVATVPEPTSSLLALGLMIALTRRLEGRRAGPKRWADDHIRKLMETGVDNSFAPSLGDAVPEPGSLAVLLAACNLMLRQRGGRRGCALSRRALQNA